MYVRSEPLLIISFVSSRLMRSIIYCWLFKMFSTLSNVLAVVPAAQWWGGWGRLGATGFHEFLNLGLNFFRFTWFLASDLFSRFACFPCNFDLCESCITRKLGRSLLNPAPTGYQQETIGPMDPSAPLLPQHEEPPPSYQEAIRERV